MVKNVHTKEVSATKVFIQSAGHSDQCDYKVKSLNLDIDDKSQKTCTCTGRWYKKGKWSYQCQIA